VNKRSKITTLAVLILCCAVTLCLTSQYFEKKIYPLSYRDLIESNAEKNGYEPYLLSAVVYCESSFNPEAVSRVGAIGLMQLMPDTFDWLTRLMGDEFVGGEITDAETNLACGSYYLGWLIRKFGSVETALAAYNAGHGNVQNWLTNPEYSDDGVTLKEIPFEETRNFVAKVISVSEIYKRLYFG